MVLLLVLLLVMLIVMLLLLAVALLVQLPLSCLQCNRHTPHHTVQRTYIHQYT